ncbi:MAG TPA: ATP-dependent zinc metalloprotease FtsH [Stellaceae bacterium]|nr:ATP-dependent zinc metalloprotease FtsH [Stellaceae bacterium]
MKVLLKQPGALAHLLTFLTLIVVAGLFAYAFVYSGVQSGRSAAEPPATQASPGNIPFSDLKRLLADGEIASSSLRGQVLVLHKKNGEVLTARVPLPGQGRVADSLVEAGVDVSVEPTGPYIDGSLLSAAIWILFFVLAFILMKRSGINPMRVGRSRATMIPPDANSVKFEDVAGIDEAKAELDEIVQFVRQPERFSRLGGKIPKGVLLSGPPGTGKTLLARAIAGEAGVPFFSDAGPGFTEMFIGVGAARIRDLFKRAKKHAPCIVFIDEIDAVGGVRGRARSHGEDDKTLNQLLVEMDGFEPSIGVIIIAATNRPELLDSALLRPGRFDRHVAVGLPDINGRRKILQVHTRKLRLDDAVDLNVIARGTPGFSGAQLANLANEAALLASGRRLPSITMACFEIAKDKVLMGSERPSLTLSETARRVTAYHEAGHALVAIHSPASDPIHKATIMPRGNALGMVVRLPEDDQACLTRDKLEADLAVAMGGRVAEEIAMGPGGTTTGAATDIKQATRIARRMVVEWGMSDALGPLAYTDAEDGVQPTGETARVVDAEVKRIVEDAERRARLILEARRQELEAIAQALCERETLTAADIRAVAAAAPMRV